MPVTSSNRRLPSQSRFDSPYASADSFSRPFHVRDEDELNRAANLPRHLLWERMDQAGVCVRFAAHCLDAMILHFILYLMLVGFACSLRFESVGGTLLRIALLLGVEASLKSLLFGWLVAMGATCFLYEAVFDCSRLRATPGKLAFGIIVTTTTDEHPSFLRALLRSILKLFSALLLGFGFLLAFASSERLAMHDILSGTRVRETYRRSALARWLLAAAIFLGPTVAAYLTHGHL